ncbi:hypothetical protein UNDYM_3206 [Undibacterium sp. YM2]|jgi:hypothetical protein|uniref:hypothetical protein n=1 Tax=Undibacterium sp. YM2 TaxID=2058625 RepID=UPI001331F184|nr:hypothetical protein [Undibacterium sp. YM2]BBB67459.1 hypothetical protein UNDYM_3206 [Undibacterium sp. YM2]
MRRNIIGLAAILIGALGLSGCVVAPAQPYGYGYGYGPRVYVSPPPVIIQSGPYWGGGGRHWRRW